MNRQSLTITVLHVHQPDLRAFRLARYWVSANQQRSSVLPCSWEFSHAHRILLTAFTVLTELKYCFTSSFYCGGLHCAITVSCHVSLVDARRSTQARLQHLVNITSLYGNHCASFNRNLASFTILYYWTSSPPRRVLLQLNLQYSQLTVCGYLLTIHESSVTLTNVFLVVVLLTEGDELLLLINELESREGRLSLFFSCP